MLRSCVYIGCPLCAQSGCMAAWTLFCPNCHFSFVHSTIEVKEIADYFLPAKPDIAAAGTQFKCSNCGHTSLYTRNDIIYQA
jgi:hypothetical protein